MKSVPTLLCSLLLCALVGCESSRTLSTIRDEHTAYAIKGADAKRLMDEALATQVPTSGIDHSPHAGVASIGRLQSGTDVQEITISALPVSGVNRRGEIVEGYGFIIEDRGPVVNALATRSIYGSLKQQALSYGEVIATAKPQQ